MATKQVRVTRTQRARQLRAHQAVKARRLASGEQGLRPRWRVYTEPVEDRRV